MATRTFRIKIDGKTFEAEVEEIGEQTNNIPQPIIKTEVKKPQAMPKPAPVSGNMIVAPMPGKIIKILVTKGKQVKTGDVLLILEAMKMEQEIRTNQDGKITEISVAEGQSVKKEDVLVVFE